MAGTTTAETIRQHDSAGSIGIVSDEPYILYSRVMLSKPNFFLGKIPFDKVWLKDEKWYTENNIAFLGGKTVSALDAKEKLVSLTDGESISYEKLLIATGTATRKTHIPGAEKKGVHYLRSLNDGKGIMENIKTAKSAVTVGGGFIGFEMADLMQLAGLKTTIILREPYFWDPALDQASGKMIEEAMSKVGVSIIHGTEVVEVLGGESVEGVVLKDGTKIPCDMVIFGIGTVSALDWIKSAGLSVNRGIVANEFMETSIGDIWTAGDITEYKDLLLEENVQMGNWVSAHEQGRVAGMGMTGDRQAFKFVSFYMTNGFGLTVAFVGDATPGANRVIIPRGSSEINSYARIIMVGNEIEGATLVNRTGEMAVISKLIEGNIDISTHLAELTDPSFDLKKLMGGKVS